MKDHTELAKAVMNDGLSRIPDKSEAVSSNALFAELISDIEGIASNVANCSTDSQASDDCATICQMIQDFKANVKANDHE